MSETRTLHLPDLAATRGFAAGLARVLRAGDVVGLSGDLGAGKSELARAMLRARAGAPIEVPSPTFTLLQVYDLPDIAIGHADLYRLGGPDEIPMLGFDEIVQRGALLVEWAERAAGMLPAPPLALTLVEADDPDARRLQVEAPDSWTDRLAALCP